MHSRIGAVITAAGASRRFGASLKKEYNSLNNKPVLVHSIETFIKTGLFARIVVTIPAGDREQVKALLQPYLDVKTIFLVPGGATRQDSVYKGLQNFQPDPPEIVLIHDGARPGITTGIICAVVEKTRELGGAVPVVDIVDALVEVDGEGRLSATLDRHKIKAVQTPQGFIFSAIIEAHCQAREQGVEAVDDATLYRLLGREVYTVAGSLSNRKITYPGDLG